MSEELCELGVVGLSAVGQSLAAHHASDGVRVCVCDEDPHFVPQVVQEYRSQIAEADADDDDEGDDEGDEGDEEDDGSSSDRRGGTRRRGRDRRRRRLDASRCMIPSGSVEEIVPMLMRPRRIVVCGTHGRDDRFVEHCWDRLFPLLEEGDVVLRWGREDEGGGTGGGTGGGGCDRPAPPMVQYYDAAVAGKLSRTQARPRGIHLLEMVRLGRDRLLHSTSSENHSFLVGGGSTEAYSLIEPYVSSYGGTSIAHVGNDPASAHYAIMIQRSIENGFAQAYAEGSDVLRRAGGYENQDIGRAFRNWNESSGGDDDNDDGGGITTTRSYLAGISSRIYYKRDTVTKSGFVIDHIVDAIPSDPVDTWATLEATRLGVPAPTVNATMETRFLSVMRDERMEASSILKVPELNDTPSVLRDQIAEDLRRAIHCACLCIVAECLAIFEAASEAGSWDANAVECVRMWKMPGSFLESTLLDRIHSALADDRGDSNSLLTIPVIASELQGLHMSWRRIVTLSFASAVPCPTLSSSLTHYDSYRSGRLPVGLIRAQRDYFDASGYDRLGEGGWFSTCWINEHAIQKKKEAAAASQGGNQRTRKRKAKLEES
jgi:6-phosphogluconate dehydrogenase